MIPWIPLAGIVIGLIGAMITAYMRISEKLALANLKTDMAIRQNEKLETRVNELEDSIVKKMDKIQESVHSIEINISKLVKP